MVFGFSGSLSAAGGSPGRRPVSGSPVPKTAEPVIQDMGAADQDDGEGEEAELVLVPYLLGYQEQKPSGEQGQGYLLPVMPAEAMPEGPGSDNEGKADHSVFEGGIVDDVHAQDRQACYRQGENSTVDSAQYGGGNAQGIPIDFRDHTKQNANIRINATLLQKLLLSLFSRIDYTVNNLTLYLGRQAGSRCAVKMMLIMNKKKLGLWVVFFVLLFVGFYFVLTRIIPGYGTVQLPVLNYVQAFSFTNQEGRQITEKDVAGKVYVAEYFFTTCKGICPKMNSNVKKISAEFANEPDFRVLSYTVDPGTDTVSRMKRYADSLGADPDKWWFLTGRKDSLYSLARGSYLLDDPKNNRSNIEEQFIHTQFLALVDKSGRVRKIYDSLKKNELDELEKDIKALLKEAASAPRFANSLFNNNPG